MRKQVKRVEFRGKNMDDRFFIVLFAESGSDEGDTKEDVILRGIPWGKFVVYGDGNLFL
jgi:hypothetical protein